MQAQRNGRSALRKSPGNVLVVAAADTKSNRGRLRGFDVNVMCSALAPYFRNAQFHGVSISTAVIVLVRSAFPVLVAGMFFTNKS